MAKRLHSNIAVSKLLTLGGITFFTTRGHSTFRYRTLVAYVGKGSSKAFAKVGQQQAVPLHEAR